MNEQLCKHCGYEFADPLHDCPMCCFVEEIWVKDRMYASELYARLPQGKRTAILYVFRIEERARRAARRFTDDEIPF